MKDHQNPELSTIRSILNELSEVAEHATLTGSLSSGVRQAAQSYNGALAFLTARGSLPEGMFDPMDVDRADYGEIGVQCRLLLAATNVERRREGRGYGDVVALAPFLKSEDLAELVREQIGEATLPTDLLAGLAPFLDSETLGSLVRRRMGRIPEPPAPPSPPSPTVPPVPTWDARPVVAEERLPVGAPPEPRESLESLAAKLQRPDLSPEERQGIATRLAELAYEQASHALVEHNESA
jgi:hypothetical protein